MKKLIVYSINNCPYCLKVKRYLNSKNVEFEERNIENSKIYEEECRNISGDVSVPVTIVEGNSEDFVFKFERENIDKLIKLREWIIIEEEREDDFYQITWRYFLSMVIYTWNKGKGRIKKRWVQ